METIRIVEVTEINLSILQEISQQTFIETYASENTEEDMTRYLNEELSLEKISTEFNDGKSRFYFARLDNEVIGYLKIAIEKSPNDFTVVTALEIKRIYVRQEFQGKKVGQLLFEKAVSVAKEMDVDYMWLAVWEENIKAINFYRRNGFTEFGKLVFVLGDDEQTGIKMKMQLKGN